MIDQVGRRHAVQTRRSRGRRHRLGRSRRIRGHHASTAYLLPDELPFDIAPSLPSSYGTACAALSQRARLLPGETLLVHGAAGAVGLAAVEIGKALGATVVATASTEEKLALARSHGTDRTVLFPSATALEELKAILPGGAQVVFDPIGGDAFDLSLRCVANSGRILVIGFAGGRVQQIPANIILVKDVAVLGFNFGSYTGWNSRHQPAKHAWAGDARRDGAAFRLVSRREDQARHVPPLSVDPIS